MKYRPTFHPTASYGWINDPNGFSYFNGEFHLYAQHNPHDLVWGPIHWLHFTSKDLIHFEEKGIVLKPDQPYDQDLGCFSGSAIIKDNKMYVLYTSASNNIQTQSLAISEDGYHFNKYENNPVLSEKDLPEGYLISDFRDPKIILYQGTYYVLLVARHKDQYSSILLYKTTDLIHYEFVNVIKSFLNMEENGMVECPDLLCDNGKWALIYSFQHPSNYQKDFTVCYQVGDFDFAKGVFTPIGIEHELEQGLVGYASHTIKVDGQNYYVSWLSSWGINYPSKEEGYAGVLSLIKKINIVGDRLYINFLANHPRSHIIDGEVTADKAKISLENIDLFIDKNNNYLEIYRHDLDTKIINDKNIEITNQVVKLNDASHIHLEIIIDHSVIEIVVNHGEAFLGIDNYRHDIEKYKVLTTKIK